MTRRTAVKAATVATVIVLLAGAIWGAPWALTLWSPRGQLVFEAGLLLAFGGVVIAIQCAIEDRRARS